MYLKDIPIDELIEQEIDQLEHFAHVMGIDLRHIHESRKKEEQQERVRRATSVRPVRQRRTSMGIDAFARQARIVVHVIEGKDLCNVAGSSGATSDPYVSVVAKMRMGSSTKIFRTHVERDTLSPVFEEDFVFGEDRTGIFGLYQLDFKVFDSGRHDKPMGMTSVKISDIETSPGKAMSGWQKLDTFGDMRQVNITGSIHIGVAIVAGPEFEQYRQLETMVKKRAHLFGRKHARRGSHDAFTVRISTTRPTQATTQCPAPTVAESTNNETKGGDAAKEDEDADEDEDEEESSDDDGDDDDGSNSSSSSEPEPPQGGNGDGKGGNDAAGKNRQARNAPPSSANSRSGPKGSTIEHVLARLNVSSIESLAEAIRGDAQLSEALGLQSGDASDAHALPAAEEDAVDAQDYALHRKASAMLLNRHRSLEQAKGKGQPTVQQSPQQQGRTEPPQQNPSSKGAAAAAAASGDIVVDVEEAEELAAERGGALRRPPNLDPQRNSTANRHHPRTPPESPGSLSVLHSESFSRSPTGHHGHHPQFGGNDGQPHQHPHSYPHQQRQEEFERYLRRERYERQLQHHQHHQHHHHRNIANDDDIGDGGGGKDHDAGDAARRPQDNGTGEASSWDHTPPAASRGPIDVPWRANPLAANEPAVSQDDVGRRGAQHHRYDQGGGGPPARMRMSPAREPPAGWGASGAGFDQPATTRSPLHRMPARSPQQETAATVAAATSAAARVPYRSDPRSVSPVYFENQRYQEEWGDETWRGMSDGEHMLRFLPPGFSARGGGAAGGGGSARTSSGTPSTKKKTTKKKKTATSGSTATTPKSTTTSTTKKKKKKKVAGKKAASTTPRKTPGKSTGKKKRKPPDGEGGR